MDNQNSQSKDKQQSSKQQQGSESKQSGISQNRTRQEKTQDTSDSDNTGQDAPQQEQSAQPKFQSKHKDRSVQPPDKDETQKATGTEAGGAAAASGSVTMPGGQESQQATGNGQTESAPATGDTDALGQSQGGSKQAPQSTSQPQQTDAETSQAGPSPAVNDQSGSVLPPESHLASLDGKKKSSGSSKGKGRWLALGIIVALLVLAFGGYVAYAQYIAPRQAPVSYIQRLSEMESGKYQLSATSTSDKIDMGIDAEGKFTQSSNGSELPQISNSSTVNYGQDGLNVELDFDVRFLDDTAYFRLNNVGMLAMFMPGLDTEDVSWYHYEFDEEQLKSLTSDEECSEQDLEKLEEYFDDEAADRITITNPQRQDWFGEERNGHRVRHYSGELAGSDLKNILQGAAEVTSESCIKDIKDGSSVDFEDSNLKYDLYVGDGRDEAVVRVFQEGEEKAQITLITSNYNQEVDITAPEDSEPMEGLLQGRSSLDMGPGSGLEGSGGSFNMNGSSSSSGSFESNLQ